MEQGDLFDDDASFRSPPPPDDRLWRHPSEIGWTPSPPRRNHGVLTLAAASGAVGAVLAVGVLAFTGSLRTRVDTREVVQRVAVPAAVSTSTTDADAQRVALVVAPSIVHLRVHGDTDREATGVIFRTDGHVLTNAHVVADATSIVATLADGSTAGGHVVGQDDDTDIAVLKLDGPGPFRPAVLGTTSRTMVGDPAVAVGERVSSGVVSAVGREISPAQGRTLVDMIQTDAEVDTASSGGALLASDGTVIGITTAYASNARVGFATPVEVAKAVADDLLAVGHVRAVWLGITGSSAPDAGGVAVADVVTDGPAHRAGLVAGDVIRRVAGHPIASISLLRVALRRNHPGESIEVVFDRSGSRHTATVVLAERPASS